MSVTLFAHQTEALHKTENFDCVAYYLDMGLGKTFVGSEQMQRYGNHINLLVCQKSKIDDWIEHFRDHYQYKIFNLTKKAEYEGFLHYVREWDEDGEIVGVINYELTFRRQELKQLRNFTLMLDESSMIQNEKAKRSKFLLSLHPKNTILLSGTPTAGKYERLWSQVTLLGWDIGKTRFWDSFVITRDIAIQGVPFPIKKVVGYKNVERLKRKLAEHGAIFMKTEDVFDLPDQIDQTIGVQTSLTYRKFKKQQVVSVINHNGNEIELVGDTTLTKMLYERMLCGSFSSEKVQAFSDLLESTEDRLIVFYNFTAELEVLRRLATKNERPVSVVNGMKKDLSEYETEGNSVTFVQYQAGSMGLNLQKANKIVYFTPPVSAELYMQSRKRTHRLKQERTCFYYHLVCSGSIEEKIYDALAKGVDYTERLFERGE